MGDLSKVEIHSATDQSLIDILENAFAVGYEKAANQTPIAWFSLPRDDAKWSAIAAFREAWLYDTSGALIDCFRIVPYQELHDDTTQAGRIQLEGIGTVLQDDLVSAEVTWTNQTVTQILTDILAYQSVTRVTLGTIDASLNLTIAGYRVSFDNVMKGCWDLRNVVGGYISIDPVAGTPATRKLNLRASPGQDIGQRIWKGWNLRALGKTTDPTEAVTKLWPLGRGEGQNQQRPSSDLLTAQPATLANSGVVGQYATLTITDLYSRYKGWTAAAAALPTGVTASDTRSRPLKVLFGATDDSVNWRQGADERTLQSATTNYTPPAGTPTLNYVHADYLIADDTVGTYGTIARPYPDKRFESSLDLIRAARSTMDVVKQPRVTYDVKAADLVRNLPAGDAAITLETFNLYDQINVVDDVLAVALKLRIVKVRYSDIWNPDTFELGVGLLPSQPAEVRLQDRQRKYDTTPDGATNIWVDSFEDNLDAAHPYTRSIYIPSDAVAVNKLTLNLKTKPYRYYVSAAASSGTSGGGVTSSSSGGGTTATSGSSNAQTTTDAAHEHGQSTGASLTSHSGTAVSVSSDSSTTGNQNYLHQHFENNVGTYTDTESAGGNSGNHGHSHTHGHGTTVTNPTDHGTHYHTGAQLDGTHLHGTAHTHTVTISSHTHTTDTTHSHTITTSLTPGIIETTTPSTMQVKVDGSVASASATSLTDFDLTPYLTKDSSGKIVRGWHDITFTPDVNGRIQAAVVEVVFIQSRGVVAG